MKRRHRFALAALAGLFGIWATCSLGFWQLRRAADKETRQRSIEAAALAVPMSPTANELASPGSLVDRHLRWGGRWLADRVVYLDNRQSGGQPGFYVLMALRIDTPIVADLIVNRGWIPRNMSDRARIVDYRTPAEPVEVTGIALADEPRLLELAAPGERSLKGIWQNFDFGEYAKAAGQKPLPFVVRQDATVQPAGSDGTQGDGLMRDWPDRGRTLQAQIDRHHGYAFQWFALAATLLVLLLYSFFRLVRHERTIPR